ncbi:MAG: enoyl-CoA hydratase [Chloroflexota bacterium]
MELQLQTTKIIAKIEDSIGWLIFNNPARRNAVSLEMWQAIPQVIKTFEEETAVRVIVLTGMGPKAFVAGADISEFDKVRNSPENVAYYSQQAGLANDALVNASKPTIAMIRGVCVGGGVGIALQCDMRIAAEDARFAIPAAKLGLGYAHGGLKQLVDLVGPAYAKEIFYTARLFSASEAQQMGLVNRVVQTAVLDPYVRDYCQKIAQNAPLTIQSVKKIVDQITAEAPLDAAYCEKLVQDCFDSEDYIEGRTAFMEKRKPNFKGK